MSAYGNFRRMERDARRIDRHECNLLREKDRLERQTPSTVSDRKTLEGRLDVVNKNLRSIRDRRIP